MTELLYNKIKIIFIISASLLAFAGCSNSNPLEANKPYPKGSFTKTAPIISQFNDTMATEDNGVLIDLSSVDSGFVGVSTKSDKRLKIQVLFEKTTYTYDLLGDGTKMLFPLQSGSGAYGVRIMKNTTDNKYVQLTRADFEAEIADSYSPFLRSSAMIDFTAESDCVKKADELVLGLDNDSAVVAAVYDYIKETIEYDYDFAKSRPKEYIANPDEILKKGSGICFDYATLAAAMLRSQGIPTKLVTGYVAPNDLYHAWNSVYLKDVGWVTVRIKSSPDIWQMIDTTFASTSGNNFVPNSTDYTQKYIY